MAEIFKCPDCERTFANSLGLSMHRVRSHSEKGKTWKGPTQHWRKKSAGSFPCPHCDFVAKWEGGLKHHVNKKHNRAGKESQQLAKTNQNAIQIPQNGNVQTADDTNHRLEAAATFAAGRVAELLQSVALQHDLPPKSLAALVLRVVHSQAVR